MDLEIIKNQKKQTQGRVHALLSKHSVGNADKTNAKREKFLDLLKSRNGYSNEKAVDELDRLLKQFYRINRNSGIHHTRPKLFVSTS